MPNDQLFIDVLAQIEREPERWVQSAYYCETGMCFAGWACVLSGLDVHIADIPSSASRSLGIDEWEQGRNHLFHGGNDLDSLYAVSAAILGLDVTVLRDKVQDALTSHVLDDQKEA